MQKSSGLSGTNRCTLLAFIEDKNVRCSQALLIKCIDLLISSAAFTPPEQPRFWQFVALEHLDVN